VFSFLGRFLYFSRTRACFAVFVDFHGASSASCFSRSTGTRPLYHLATRKYFYLSRDHVEQDFIISGLAIHSRRLPRATRKFTMTNGRIILANALKVVESVPTRRERERERENVSSKLFRMNMSVSIDPPSAIFSSQSTASCSFLPWTDNLPSQLRVPADATDVTRPFIRRQEIRAAHSRTHIVSISVDSHPRIAPRSRPSGRFITRTHFRIINAFRK